MSGNRTHMIKPHYTTISVRNWIKVRPGMTDIVEGHPVVAYI